MTTNTLNIVDEYIKTHPGSQKLHERAMGFFAANGATHQLFKRCSQNEWLLVAVQLISVWER